MYKYYAEHESENHYLFSSEIAELLYKIYGITNDKGSYPTKLVESYLYDFEKKCKMVKLYYNTRNGLRRVYPAGQWMVENAHKIFDVRPGRHVINIGEKKYKYRVAN